jgi:hypothetical protein
MTGLSPFANPVILRTSAQPARSKQAAIRKIIRIDLVPVLAHCNP